MSEARIDNLREELGGDAPEVETPETPETDAPETPETPPEEPENPETPETPETPEVPPVGVLDGDDVPEKFRGKTGMDVVKAYQELETLIGQRTLGKDERQDLKDAGMGRKDLSSMDDMKKVLEGTDFTKMDAKQFAEWLVNITDERATSRAREIYTTASTVQQAVRTEIEEATSQFPLLKSNKEFRDLTLAVIEADASRGVVTPIVEASKKVSAMMTAQKQQEDQVKNDADRKRTAVEAPKGGSGDGPDTDAEKVLKGLTNSGGGASPMGGLGI